MTHAVKSGNGLKRVLLPGLVVAFLYGCASRPVQAPVVELKPLPPRVQPAPPAAGASGPTYTVRRGDTLYSIALEHGIDYRDLAQWNRLNDPARIREGQSLRLNAPPGQEQPAPVVQPPQREQPAVALGSVNRAGSIDARPLDGGASASAASPTSRASAAPVRTEPKALRLPYSKENLALLSKDEPPSAALQKPAPVPAKVDSQPAEAMAFVWPAKGRVIGAFSEPANKGLDIEGKPGDPVFAAASGRVMYTGTGIRGYGKLIVIKHDDGYNTVYAHNREILVREGQSVARGERIAELGDSDADRPKLHFEIRKSGKPVDPMKFLEAR